MVFDNILKVMALRKLTQKELAEKIGMSENGLHLAIKKRDARVSTIQNIADVLCVNIAVLFNDSTPNIKINQSVIGENIRIGESKNYEVLQQKIESLERELKGKDEMLKAKDETIRSKDEIIGMLRELGKR